MTRPRFAFGIRAKLLLASSVLFAIPWLGYEYIRELERFLRLAQEQRIAGTAQAVATALHDRPRLFERPLPESLASARKVVDLTSGEANALDAGAKLEQSAHSTMPTPSGGGSRAPEAAAGVGSAAEIEQIIKGLARTTARIWVVDRDLRVLARAGNLHQPTALAMQFPEEASFGLVTLWQRFEEGVLHPLFSPLYRFILRQPSDDFTDDLAQASHLDGKEVEQAMSGIPTTRRWFTSDGRAVVISAAHPIWVSDTVRGAVVVEETTNPVLAQQNRAFARLFNIVLAVLLIGSVTLFLFASNLSVRIRRLRNEAERAVDAHGRVQQITTGSSARDEIGDLSRSFSEVLTKLSQYTSYQENMANRLSHELRTPIAVVRSSLENLDLQPLPGEAKIYMDRAREGLERLQHILRRMSEASSLQQMLQSADRERFDLTQLLASCVEGYRSAYPLQKFEVTLPSASVHIVGVPDAFAQMLDKLVANAVDFSFEGHPITVTFAVEGDDGYLIIANVGEYLPDEMEGRLFDSMVSVRAHKGGDAPHLGLGLYVVRLVAEFHGGTASLTNRTDVEGVIAMIRLPLNDAI